jgi:hypothetical protein
MAVVLILHVPFLRWCARFLVAEESYDNCQYIGILEWYNRPDGDRCYDAAAEIHRQRPAASILVVEARRNRLVEIGALPSFEQLSRRELQARGVPQQSIRVIHSDGDDDWATVRAVRNWLTEQPATSVLLLCAGFSSAHLRYAFDVTLDPAEAARVRVRGLPDRRFDQTNWWTSRSGIKAFGNEWIRQLHGWCAGGDHRPRSLGNADAYERDVLEATTGMP